MKTKRRRYKPWLYGDMDVSNLISCIVIGANGVSEPPSCKQYKYEMKNKTTTNNNDNNDNNNKNKQDNNEHNIGSRKSCLTRTGTYLVRMLLEVYIQDQSVALSHKYQSLSWTTGSFGHHSTDCSHCLHRCLILIATCVLLLYSTCSATAVREKLG